MQNHTDLLNYIAEKIKATSYLEIGVQNRSNNFDKILVENKSCVDPDTNAKADYQVTSDIFFKYAHHLKLFDLVLCDGLHHADQVKRDIVNSWRCLSEGGVIVIHDSNPHKEGITHVPRDSKEWTGDVYKTICQIISPKFTVDFDYGCCVIRKEKQGDELQFTDQQFEWEEFDLFRKELLKLVTVEEAKRIIDTWI